MSELKLIYYVIKSKCLLLGLRTPSADRGFCMLVLNDLWEMGITKIEHSHLVSIIHILESSGVPAANLGRTKGEFVLIKDWKIK